MLILILTVILIAIVPLDCPLVFPSQLWILPSSSQQDLGKTAWPEERMKYCKLVRHACL